MKKYFIISIGLALLFCMTIQLQTVKAQVYSNYEAISIKNETYTPLTSAVQIYRDQFTMPPTQQINWDDGYYTIPLKFKFEFNGEIYSQVNVCVNGFITFSDEPYLPAKTSTGLFGDGVSYPKNVIAPYWGDHFYRNLADEDSGYMQSKILYRSTSDMLIIEWRNLNINDSTVKSSVGNFQLILYASKDPLSYQGDIEFAYGQCGGNPNTTSTVVITKGASVGLKGETTISKGVSDFLNGLYNGNIYAYNSDSARHNTNLTIAWTPSGGTDQRIRFAALTRYNDELYWGDGDADMSKDSKHKGLDQNRYVTMNDARSIIHSISTDIPLDSVIKRNAYHGDVNHNGRYFYYQYSYTIKVKGISKADSLDPISGNKVYKVIDLIKRYDIPWKNEGYADSLLYIHHVDNYEYKDGKYTDTIIKVDQIVPSGINSIKRIYFQVTEYDASLILNYMGCKLPSLPWLYDTIIWHGKIAADEKLADDFKFGNVTSLGNGDYQVPVYVNGYVDKNCAGKFEIGDQIIDCTVPKSETNDVETSLNNNKVVFAASGQFDETNPLFILTFKSASNNVKVSNIRYNDVNKNDIAIKTSGVDNQDVNNEISLQNTPNPASANTTFTFNLPTDANYQLAIYDMYGQKVKSFTNELKAGPNSILWNTKDENGNQLMPGMYIYKLTGDNLSLTNKLVIIK